MKKSILIPIIIGATCLTVGGTLFTIGLVHNTKTSNSNSSLITNEYNINEFSNIDININTANLEFKLSSNNERKVVCKEIKDIKHTVEVKDNTLYISNKGKTSWYQNLFEFTNTKMEVIVYVPSTSFDLAKINLTTGNIYIPNNYSFNNLSVEQTTGNIKVESKVKENINVKSTTGNLYFETETKNINLKCTSGNINLKNTSCENLNINVTSGKTSLDEVKVSSKVNISSTTGDIKIDNSQVNDLITKATTGDVYFNELSQTSLIDIETTTGDVNLSLVSSRTFDVKTTTGDINTPNSVNGAPTCKVRTTTGDVNIKIK